MFNYTDTQAQSLRLVGKLQAQLREAVARRDYVKISLLQARLNQELNRREHVTLASILEDMSEEEKKQGIVLMNRVFVLADLLHGYANDFAGFIKKISPDMTLPIVKTAQDASKLCLSITKAVTSFRDDRFTDSFQSMADEADLVLCNIIEKYRARADHARTTHNQNNPVDS